MAQAKKTASRRSPPKKGPRATKAKGDANLSASEQKLLGELVYWVAARAVGQLRPQPKQADESMRIEEVRALRKMLEPFRTVRDSLVVARWRTGDGHVVRREYVECGLFIEGLKRVLRHEDNLLPRKRRTPREKNGARTAWLATLCVELAPHHQKTVNEYCGGEAPSEAARKLALDVYGYDEHRIDGAARYCREDPTHMVSLEQLTEKLQGADRAPEYDGVALLGPVDEGRNPKDAEYSDWPDQAEVLWYFARYAMKLDEEDAREVVEAFLANPNWAFEEQRGYAEKTGPTKR